MRYLKVVILLLILSIGLFPMNNTTGSVEYSPLELETYTPSFTAFNIKEQMSLTPMFTPDNALDLHVAWIDLANLTLDIQNQYLTQFDDNLSWENDPSPIVRAIVRAHNRGVAVRVQINEGSDSDDITIYFQSVGISVRWMGNSVVSDSSYLSDTHNKLVIIDGKITLLSSINFSENAFTNNREAGMVIQSQSVSSYYLSIFESDWADGETPPYLSKPKINVMQTDFVSHTDIPKTNFTGVYNVTAFTNPDNADEVIFKYLKSAQTSIYVSMYTFSRVDFTDTLIALKKANPSIDIQVLISNRRVNAFENADTQAAAEALVSNLIPVHNSTKDTDKVNGFYHNKYWIIDGKHSFVYSGNWSPRSVTPQLEEGDTTYGSTEANRDMGIAILDATDIASFFTNVWNQDVAVSDSWELPIGIKQNSFSNGEVISGKVTISAVTSGLNASTASYRWNTDAFTSIDLTDNSFSLEFDTATLDNGISTLEVKVDDFQLFEDKVRVNVVNAPDWRFLITEVHPDPDVVSDTEGEFFELTNSFPFSLLIGGWQAGDYNNNYIFDDNYEIGAYTSIIFARSKVGFKTGLSTTADFEFSFSLVNGGDLIQLLNNDDELIDVVAYGSATALDGSEVLQAPDAGMSLSRINLHIDTNKATDFEISTPSPKADVPHVDLSDTNSDVGLVPFPFVWTLLALPILIRRRKND